MNPFDYVSAINFHKNIIKDDLTEKEYNAFIINRAFSYYNDTLMQSNELNQKPWIDKKMQNDFLLTSIRPRKRWSKWAKSPKIANFDLVKEYYGYNNDRTTEALAILSKEDIEVIKQKMYRGGE